MAVTGSSIQAYGGDAPNITGIEQYIDQIVHAVQQMDMKIWNLIPTKSLPIGTRTLWIPKMDALDGTNGYQDTMTSGLVTGSMDDAGADINEFSSSTDRFGFTKNMTLSNVKRQLSGTKYDVTPFIPEDDLLSTGWIDVMQNTKIECDYRWNRYRDSVLLAALQAASVYEGTDDTTTGAFPTATVAFADGGGKIVGGASTTPDRSVLEEILYQFKISEVDIEVEKPIILCNPLFAKYLRAQEELISRDYTSHDNVDSRTIHEAGGFRIIESNLITATDGYHNNVAFMPSAMKTAEWGAMRVKESYRADRRDGLQIAMKYESGAVRVEDKKVIWVRTKDSSL